MSRNDSLQQEIIDELKWDPSLAAAHIGVTARDGIVTLTGHVTSFAEKYAAEAATSRVKGVKGIAEEIEVCLPFDAKRSDYDIAAAAIDRLAWDTFIPRDAIKVQVEEGRVTLTGQVEWHYQKDAAEQDVCRLFGVTGVSNQIAIRPKPNAADISDDIQHALHRTWFSNPKTVTVTASDGEIRLTGTVRSLQDRNVALAVAWAAPGAIQVENNIQVI